MICSGYSEIRPKGPDSRARCRIAGVETSCSSQMFTPHSTGYTPGTSLSPAILSTLHTEIKWQQETQVSLCRIRTQQAVVSSKFTRHPVWLAFAMVLSVSGKPDHRKRWGAGGGVILFPLIVYLLVPPWFSHMTFHISKWPLILCLKVLFLSRKVPGFFFLSVAFSWKTWSFALFCFLGENVTLCIRRQVLYLLHLKYNLCWFGDGSYFSKTHELGGI